MPNHWRIKSWIKFCKLLHHLLWHFDKGYSGERMYKIRSQLKRITATTFGLNKRPPTFRLIDTIPFVFDVLSPFMFVGRIIVNELLQVIYFMNQHQTSANNSTSNHYLSKTRRLEKNSCKNPCKINGRYSLSDQVEYHWNWQIMFQYGEY